MPVDEELGLRHVTDLPVIRRERHAILGQRLGRVLNRQCLPSHPDGGPLPSEAALPVQPPVPKPDGAASIEHARGPETEEPVEVGRITPGTLHPAEDGGWAAAPSGEIFGTEVMQPSGERYAGGDKAGAVELFLRGVCGPQMREVADQALPPGAFDLAVADADTFFLTEGPALQEWRFGPGEAARIEQPVLLVLGVDTDAVAPMFGEMHAALAEWLPRAEPAELPGATHALQMMNPAGMAELLTDFFARHPMPTAVG